MTTSSKSSQGSRQTARTPPVSAPMSSRYVRGALIETLAGRVRSYRTPFVLKPDALRMGITRSAALLNTVWIAWRTPCACIESSFIAILLVKSQLGALVRSTLCGKRCSLLKHYATRQHLLCRAHQTLEVAFTPIHPFCIEQVFCAKTLL